MLESKSSTFGIHLPSSTNLTFETISSYAKRCEKLGIDSVWVADHILRNAGLGIYEPLSLLSAISAKTRTIKFGTSVLLAALRNPVLLADFTGTIQRISGNRLILGVGVGWDKREFETLGVSYSDRGQITSESLEVVSMLWSGKPQNHRGQFFRLKGTAIAAPPSKAPHVWIGGNSPAAIKRASKYDAWFPTDPTTDDIREGVKELIRISEKKRPLVAAHIYLILEESSRKASHTARFLSDMTGERLDKVRQWAIVGDVNECRQRVEEYRKAGVGYFVFSLPPKMSLTTLEQVTRMMAQ